MTYITDMQAKALIAAGNCTEYPNLNLCHAEASFCVDGWIVQVYESSGYSYDATQTRKGYLATSREPARAREFKTLDAAAKHVQALFAVAGTEHTGKLIVRLNR
jgi:hypothetical protein